MSSTNENEQVPAEPTRADAGEPSENQPSENRPSENQPSENQPVYPAPSYPTQTYPAQPAGWGHPGSAQQSNQGEPVAAPSNDPYALLSGYGTDPNQSAQAPTQTATQTRVHGQRPWTAVVAAAAVGALVASLATFGLANAFDDDSGATPSSLATIGQSSNDTAPVSGSTSDDPDWEKVAAAVSASVVAIQVTTASGGAEGSGVVIDSDGHVLTNNHVVSGAENNTVQVTLSDGRLYDATIVGTDATTDLAVVQITDAPDDLSPAAIGDSSAVVVGEPVMAVGNPLGLANTVTTGIVSAVDRPVSAQAESGSDTVVTNAIQIDAAINPGNSGGPLFDAQGRVIGITSSIATLSSSSSQSGSIGLGFAIPIDLAQDIAAQLVQSGTAEHAFLGVSLTDGEATADGTTRRGAVVQDVTAGSPAAGAAVESGDVIVAIDGSPVAGAESLTAYVRERSAGSTAKLTIVRDGTALDVTVTLAAKAAVAESATPQQSQDGSSEDGSDQVNPFDQFFGGGQG